MSVLRGRVDELRRLHALPVGSDGGLVLLGEAGMGKTALLDALPANGCTSLSVRGIRAERSLPFAALHRLLPFADAPSDGRDVRDLLVSLAADRPVLCRVDDAQWLDRETLEVLGFVARRLAGCRVTMVLAARPEPVPDSLSGLDRMWLRPLAGEAWEQRLRDVLGRDLPAGLTAALVDLTGGNPADLVALAAGLTPDQVAGRSPLPDELPEGPRRAELGDEAAALSE
ncbi:MAG: LuxR family transcriptional regulator, partial [Kibdelosporangium sp.]